LKKQRLFKVENCARKTFYVVCEDEAQAARAVEEQWRKWEYFHSEAPVLSVTCIAEHHQYPRKGAEWLLLPSKPEQANG
jgi:hypothetical protein